MAGVPFALVHLFVTPAKAGVQMPLDSRLRGNDADNIDSIQRIIR
jgi:hypothetical protein